MTWFFLIFLTTFVAAAYITRFLIENATRFNLIDVPNHRSSHSTPRPRGGGMSFVVTFVLGSLALALVGAVQLKILLPLFVGCPLVAFIGLLDDRKGVSAKARLFVHLLAAFLTCYWVTNGFTTDMNITALGPTPLSFVAQLIYSLLFIMWMINLYNFMDGADGMAGTQAIVVSLCSAALCIWQHNFQLAMLYGLLVSGVAGFLYFNWSPARIFMGDGGAYFLGFVFAALALINKMYFGESLIALMILMGTFITDATYTLIRRFLRGEKVYLAHNKHGFQRAIQKGWSHSRVVTTYNLITVFWLAPWAILAVLNPFFSTAFLVISYVPLLAGMVYLRAGSNITLGDPSASPQDDERGSSQNDGQGSKDDGRDSSFSTRQLESDL